MIGMNSLGSNGRLGNQMFQYSALVGIAKNRGFDFCIPDHSQATWFDRSQGDGIVTVYHQLQHCFKMTHLGNRFGEIDGDIVELEQHHFCQELFDECPDNVTLHGHFESYKYFENVEEEIRSDFTFKSNILEESQKFHSKNNIQDAICINARRGDFIKFQNYHAPCTESYYYECIDFLGKDRQYLITSDDISWCKKIFNGNNFIFVEETPENIRKGYFDMCVSSLCSDFIISNSTFSWWIAWLSANKNKKVCVPTPWFGKALLHLDTSDMHPSYFVEIEREIIEI